MPRLTFLQWILFAVFIAFYGFAVFALTRDYYQRHPPRTLATATPAGPTSDQAPTPGAPLTFIQREVLATGMPAAAPTGSDPEQLKNDGDQLFGQQRYAEAIPYYRRALELAPNDAEATNDLGLALFYTGQSSEAIKILRTGAEQSPTFQRIWLTLGFVGAKTGDQTGARLALEKARDLGPGNDIGQEAQRQLDRLGGK
ncbi:MAG: tetratricopeptide repeat protein [Chromatiaceae bacterium]